MKRIIAIVLAFSLFIVGCSRVTPVNNTTSVVSTKDATEIVEVSDNISDDGLGDLETNFVSLNDEALLQYVEDAVYSELESEFQSDDYIINDVSAVYISKEYLDELSYNSQANIFFGYTLDEIENQFDGQKYVFTCNDEGQTIVTQYEYYDDTYEQVLKNVAIGSGVILICVTVSVVSGGLGAPAVSAVFAASAETGATFALSTGVISGATSALVTGIQTHDVQKTVNAAALSASDGFKWGAITGVITGGASKALDLHRTAKAAKSVQEPLKTEINAKGVSGAKEIDAVGESADVQSTVKATATIPTHRESEIFAQSVYGGEEQVSYLAGERVPMNTLHATRPDLVINKANGSIEAIEVKNYNLASQQSRKALCIKLKQQVTDRVENLPTGSTQRIVLDTRGRGLSKELVDEVVNDIKFELSDVYPNIPVDVL